MPQETQETFRSQPTSTRRPWPGTGANMKEASSSQPLRNMPNESLSRDWIKSLCVHPTSQKAIWSITALNYISSLDISYYWCYFSVCWHIRNFMEYYLLLILSFFRMLAHTANNWNLFPLPYVSTYKGIFILIVCSYILLTLNYIYLVNNRLTRHSRSGKHGRLGHVIGTREMSRGRSLRSINLIWFLTKWITVDNSSKASLHWFQCWAE